MSDATLNRFLAYGTDAQRLAFTPAPPTPASGPSPAYVWFATDTKHLWVYDTGWEDLGSLSGAFALTGVISPAALGADQNDYAPTGFSTASVLRLSASIATVNITGLAGGSTGLLKLVMNVGASNNLVLKNESASSLAANRFDATGDVTLAPSAWTLLWYDGTSSRWRALVSSGGGGGGGTVTTTGTPANGNLTQFSGATSITNGDLSGDVSTSGTLVTAIGANKVTNAMLRQSGALAVIGRSANSSGNVADIQATAASGAVLRESGSTVGFGTVGATGLGVTLTPQGRLTLTTGTPVLTADTTAAGTVYYTPYIGSLVPIYTGSAWQMQQFAEVSLTLNATDNVSGSLYDIFIFNNAGTLTLGTGPAWSSTTSRGTGAGTTQISMLNGVWVNTVAITLRAGGSSLGSQAISTCTYLGTIYCTANGQTGMAFSPSAAAGGANAILGLWNAYNRVTYTSRSSDSTANWTYASATWRAANNNTSNRISYIDGLGQSSVRANYAQPISVPINTAAAIGVNRDSTSATPTTYGQANGLAAGATFIPFVSKYSLLAPSIGFHFIQAMESALTAATITFLANSTTQELNIHLEM